MDDMYFWPKSKEFPLSFNEYEDAENVFDQISAETKL